MADLATLQARLADAELAYHKLMTGALEVTVEHGDMRVETYVASDTNRLLAYISFLKGEIAKAGGEGVRRRGMIVDL